MWQKNKFCWRKKNVKTLYERMITNLNLVHCLTANGSWCIELVHEEVLETLEHNTNSSSLVTISSTCEQVWTQRLFNILHSYRWWVVRVECFERSPQKRKGGMHGRVVKVWLVFCAMERTQLKLYISRLLEQLYYDHRMEFCE